MNHLGPISVARAPEAGAREITREFARFVVQSRWDEIGEPVRHEAVRSLVNWVGCTVGGARHETVDMALGAVRAIGGTGDAVVFGRDERLSPSDAALINGISSAVLDYDSTQAKLTNIHPSGPILPALAAIAAIRPVGGAEFLHAYILGVEVACRLANGIFGSDNPGWHVTGACGGLGAAAAVGRLLGLDAGRMTAAFGIAATQAGGLREMYGTMCKSFTPGRTGQNGLLAAMLAERGFTSAKAAIEGDAGFARVLMGRGAPEAMVDGLGSSFEVMANTYKPFACAIVTHATIDGCLRLRRQHGFVGGDVAQVLLNVAPVTLKLAGNPEPRTGLESKFSVQNVAALAISAGKVDHHAFADEVARDSDIALLRARVSARADPDLAKDQALVTVHLRDGRVLVQAVDHALGGLKNPMSDADLQGKFMDLAEDNLPKSQAETLSAFCWGVAGLDDVGPLIAAAAAGAGGHA